MKAIRIYATAGAFRKALEERLRQISTTDRIDINRLRRQISFDRFLARLFHTDSVPWALKGGYALELRFKTARSTVDIDLTLQRPSEFATEDSAPNDTVREMLQAEASRDLRDWFEYRIGTAMMDLTAAPYGGARYPVEVQMDGRIFAKFHLDVGIGDVVIYPLETLNTQDWLGFAGINPSPVKLIPREQQFAEKIHAYTLPRTNPNSRVKDLVDLALLINDQKLNGDAIVEGLRLTFERRKTHLLPITLDAPPSAWNAPFNSLAEECGLKTDLLTTFQMVQGFLASTMAGEEPTL